MSAKATSSSKYRVKMVGFEDYQALVACREACPLRTDTTGYARAIAEGDYERAYRIARQSNPLPSVCSRVCQAPCEDACRRAGEDGAVAIRALKRFACEQHGVGPGIPVKEAFDSARAAGNPGGDVTGGDVVGLLRLARERRREDTDRGGRAERVAVVGSGPAGLAAAHDLALLGYEVTLYEAAPFPGGMLRWGIPEFRLPRRVLQAEIDAILDLGVELKLNSPIGKDRTIADLQKEGARAVFLAVGLQTPRWLALEGSDLREIWSGIDYLRDYERIPVGRRRCLVIGGGGVAVDCAQLALRQGAETVMVACLESWEQMPARDAEKADAREEGIRFFPGLGPKRFLGRQGKVVGVEFLEVESVFDRQGNFSPSLRVGTETALEADTVLVAVGQAPGPSIAGSAEGLAMTRRGTIRVDGNLVTNIPGVFAGGDIRDGPQSVVHAIADGKRAARSIDEYLRERKLRVRRKDFMRALGPGFMNKGSEKAPAAGSPRRPVPQRIATFEEIELPYEGPQARRQAERCRQCHIQTVFDRRLCILCGTCVDTCVENAYKMVGMEDVQGDEKVEKLTAALSRKGLSRRKMTAIIKDETRCVRCGACARRCPTGAITMEAFHVEEEWGDD